MAQKQIHIDGLGEVLIVKRRGTRTMRLSINHSNQPRLSMPPYIPYKLGVEFIKSRSDWLIANKKAVVPIKDGSVVGKTQTLRITEGTKFSVKSTKQELIVTIPGSDSLDHHKKQLDSAVENALRKQSEELLIPRLAQAARQNGYTFNSVRIKKLRSRWGSCNSKKEISLSLYLIQLPWELIDYVIIHELVHTKHMNHKAAFWSQMGEHLSDIKDLRSRMRGYSPTLL